MAVKKKDEQTQHAELLIKLRDVSGLAQLLGADDTKGAVVKVALDALIDFDTVEAWDAIAAVLTSSGRGVAELVIQRLEDIKKPGSVRALGDSLGNPDVFVRGAAVKALGRHDIGPTMAHLLRGARDPEKSLGRIAARTILRRVETRPAVLGEIPATTAEGILDLIDHRWAMELLSPSFPKKIRLMAIRRLGRIGGDEATRALISHVSHDDPEISEACWRAIEACPDVEPFILMEYLVHRDSAIKARALRVFAKFAGEDAADMCGGLARDASPEVRKVALESMAKLAPVPAIPLLEAALTDADDAVRVAAIGILAHLPDTENELLRAVFQRTGEIRRQALIALANRGIVTDDLVMPYIEFLYKGASCTDLSQREYLDSLAAVAKTLGQSRNSDALLALTSLAHSVIRRMRRAAIEGIMFFEPAERADSLFALIDTHDQDIVKNIAFGLHEAKDKRAVVPLIRAAMECRGKPMVKAKEALGHYADQLSAEFLIDLLSAKWASVRRFAAERLRRLKNPKAIPALLKASEDKDVEVQLAVFEAMGPFAGQDEGVTGRMLDAVAIGDVSVRQAVCEAFGEARCKDAVPHLVKALYNCFLRPRASEALKLIGDRKGIIALRRLERREKLFPKKPKDVLSDQNARKAGPGKH